MRVQQYQLRLHTIQSLLMCCQLCADEAMVNIQGKPDSVLIGLAHQSRDSHAEWLPSQHPFGLKAAFALPVQPLKAAITH